jgi:hypothetical protein
MAPTKISASICGIGLGVFALYAGFHLNAPVQSVLQALGWLAATLLALASIWYLVIGSEGAAFHLATRITTEHKRSMVNAASRGLIFLLFLGVTVCALLLGPLLQRSLGFVH